MHRCKYNKNTKLCTKCGKYKELTEFKKDKSRWDGLRLYCHTCEGLPNNKYVMYKANAKRRGLTFNITVDEFESLVTQPCYYCGELDSICNGVDRINNADGYDSKNCVPCCKQCNLMKHAYHYTEFIQKCKRIMEKQGLMSYST